MYNAVYLCFLCISCAYPLDLRHHRIRGRGFVECMYVPQRNNFSEGIWSLYSVQLQLKRRSVHREESILTQVSQYRLTIRNSAWLVPYIASASENVSNLQHPRTGRQARGASNKVLNHSLSLSSFRSHRYYSVFSISKGKTSTPSCWIRWRKVGEKRRKEKQEGEVCVCECDRRNGLVTPEYTGGSMGICLGSGTFLAGGVGVEELAIPRSLIQVVRRWDLWVWITNDKIPRL